MSPGAATISTPPSGPFTLPVLARIWGWRSDAVAATATASRPTTITTGATDTTIVSHSKPRRIPDNSPLPSNNNNNNNNNGSSSNNRPKSPEGSLPPSPRSTPRRMLSKSELVLECSSGTVPKTHSSIVDAGPQWKQSAVVVHHDSFLCQDAVNTTRLLNLSRKRVLDKIGTLGGNTIVDERWSCTVHKQESKRDMRYKVLVMYRGIPARSDLSDPDQPISLHEAKAIPGLMTVLSRQSKYECPLSMS
ncbi:hypothetical protein Clacol_003047 [Clathrus columnatus]|uniref:Uncharacterized protein n=1 Tax=Clathrus columnatus TaxID=1419009 RepID=A0AAV5A6H9_9AGAM|nr:hypothetical protein Clacol_003047 [Clathrus columnatus]